MNVTLEPTQDLFENKLSLPKAELKSFAVQDVKARFLSGLSEKDFSLEDMGENDILIKKLDPEKALGHFTYDSEEDYFNKLGAQMYRPTNQELGVTSGDRTT